MTYAEVKAKRDQLRAEGMNVKLVRYADQWIVAQVIVKPSGLTVLRKVG